MIFIKVTLSLAVIALAALIGKKAPSLAGLIATMPLTTLIVMLWLYSDRPDYAQLTAYTRGVLWGIVPSVLFFLAAHACLKKALPFPLVLLVSFIVWLLGAAVHRALVK